MTDIDTGRAVARRILASRRGLMCGLAGIGAAGALSACGTAEPVGDSSGSGGETGGSGSDGGGEGGAEALAQTADVPVGGGIVAGETVIVQPSADEFLAFSAVCPHMGTIVDAPNDEGVIICPNHHSEFGMEGELLKGPAETGLTEVAISVENGSITLA
ncbi:ubiquinol-cytochrome c reductase iron-sulfur subunit [Glycomyces arizonensis]|uniref:QcrA and Rieske domain-containing protein n=1 Tax=Glycomyces arizonensis TaxID=256035 RepID=UPI00040C835B|nr:Rieske (2Fe-2S) protein [Glycomyces arizonensis]